MGAHHTHHAPSITTGTRVTATAVAAVALTGAGAGIASAHDADDSVATHAVTRAAGMQAADHDTARIADHHGSSSMACDDAHSDGPDRSVAGIDLSGLGDLCSGFPFDDSTGPHDGSASHRGADSERGEGRAAQPASGPGAQPSSGQQRSSQQATPSASSNPVDTPPPPGQIRMIKLPTMR